MDPLSGTWTLRRITKCGSNVEGDHVQVIPRQSCVCGRRETAGLHQSDGGEISSSKNHECNRPCSTEDQRVNSTSVDPRTSIDGIYVALLSLLR